MTNIRRIYYLGLAGGWAGLVGALFANWFLATDTSPDSAPSSKLFVAMSEILLSGVLGAILAAALAIIKKWSEMAYRHIPSALGQSAGFGFIGGILASVVGNLVYLVLKFFLSDSNALAVGWMLLGLGVGFAIGAYERSKVFIRNASIGGALGGLVGGMAYGSITASIGAPLTGRAIAMVLLGACIGLFIGFVQTILKRGWVEVVSGYGAGRSLDLDRDEEKIGRSDLFRMSFRGPENQNLESHVFSIVHENGKFYVIPFGKLSLARTNSSAATVGGKTLLQDGDQLSFGSNVIRFRQRGVRSSSEISSNVSPATTSQVANNMSSQPLSGPKPVSAEPKPSPARPVSQRASDKSTLPPPRRIPPKD